MLSPEAYRVDGAVPKNVVLPETLADLQDSLAASADHALLAAGHGSHLFIGMPPRRLDTVVSTARLARLKAHEPADMTVSVEAGMTVDRLNETLAAAGQWLPVDPPLPEGTTLGGLIAANLSGPMRATHGSVRDLLIGLRIVLADGTVVASGGRVVKNVAGYDLHKLFVGSFGTLGVIAEATFKVKPKPEVEAVFTSSCPSTETACRFVSALRDSGLDPAWMAIASPGVLTDTGGGHGPRVVVGLAGVAASVASETRSLADLASRQDLDLHAGAPDARPRVRDFPAVAGGDVTFAVGVLPSDLEGVLIALQAECDGKQTPMQYVADPATAKLHVALTAPESPGIDGLVPLLSRARRIAAERGGHLVLYRARPETKNAVGVWGDMGPDLRLMQRLKNQFDPEHRLAPGRFVGGI